MRDSSVADVSFLPPEPVSGNEPGVVSRTQVYSRAYFFSSSPGIHITTRLHQYSLRFA